MDDNPCPNCGADVPPNAKACPECGACDQTAWSEETLYDGLDLPDDSFDYDEFVEKELSPKREIIPYGVSPFWWAVALVVLLAVLFYWLGIG